MEADVIGLMLAAATGFTPEAALKVHQKMWTAQHKKPLKIGHFAVGCEPANLTSETRKRSDVFIRGEGSGVSAIKENLPQARELLNNSCSMEWSLVR